MLTISRRVGEYLTIDPSDALPPEMTIGELFAGGPVVIAVVRGGGGQVRLGIEAPRELKVLRSELREHSA